MDSHLKKGYSTVCSEDTETADSWYIPDHAVYHSNKPHKIKVVEYLEKNLNKEVLSEPNLTKQTVSILCRFRGNEVAIMANIEQVF